MEQYTGWFLSGPFAWRFLASWVVIVLCYALWRSLGEAPQDPIRPSGPSA